MADVVRWGDLEAETFKGMLKRIDPAKNARGRGYRDGGKGKHS